MQSRTQLLTELLECILPLEPIIADLRQFPWDIETALVVLRRSHVTRLLERYLRGDLNEINLELWANSVELRDDIEYGAGDEDALKECIFVLANPAITEPLDQGLADRFLKEFR